MHITPLRGLGLTPPTTGPCCSHQAAATPLVLPSDRCSLPLCDAHIVKILIPKQLCRLQVLALWCQSSTLCQNIGLGKFA
jgi:hypothetical protein